MDDPGMSGVTKKFRDAVTRKEQGRIGIQISMDHPWISGFLFPHPTESPMVTWLPTPVRVSGFPYNYGYPWFIHK